MSDQYEASVGGKTCQPVLINTLYFLFIVGLIHVPAEV